MFVSEIFTTAPTDERSAAEMATFALLDELGIPYERVDNDPAGPMEDCDIVSEKLGSEIRKSSLIHNAEKTQYYLVMMPAHKQFNTKAFQEKMECSRPSFASEEDMMELLGVTPGTASIPCLMHDKEGKVKLVIDREIANDEWFASNACDNRSHFRIKTNDLLMKFCPAIGHRAKLLRM